jgi:F0F1-type ATP synthase assembly protein I
MPSFRRKKPSDTDPKANNADAMKYLTISWQLIITILLCFGIGFAFDKLLRLKLPVFELIFSIIGIFVALFIVIREINNKDK